MARFVALAIILAIGAGFYAFTQKSNLTTAEVKLAQTQQELADWKKRMGQYQAETKSATENLAQCNAKVTEMQTALDAASKKPGGKK